MATNNPFKKSAGFAANNMQFQNSMQSQPQHGFMNGPYNVVNSASPTMPLMATQGGQQFGGGQQFPGGPTIFGGGPQFQGQQFQGGQQFAGQRRNPPAKVWPNMMNDFRQGSGLPNIGDDENPDLEFLWCVFNGTENLNNNVKKERLFPMFCKAHEVMDKNHSRADALSRRVDLSMDSPAWKRILGWRGPFQQHAWQLAWTQLLQGCWRHNEKAFNGC